MKKNILLFTCWLIFTSTSYSQFREKKTNNPVNFDEIINNWEKLLNQSKEIPSGVTSITGAHLSQKESNEFILPHRGENSFKLFKTLNITNYDFETMRTHLFTDSNWIKERSYYYLGENFDFDSLNFILSGELVLYKVPYLEKYFYFESQVGIQIVCFKFNTSEEVETQYLPIRGFVPISGKYSNLEDVFSEAIGGRPPFNLSVKPYSSKATWRLLKLVSISN